MSHRCYIYKHFVFFRCHRHYTLIFHVFSELCRLLLLHHTNISFYPPYIMTTIISKYLFHHHIFYKLIHKEIIQVF